MGLYEQLGWRLEVELAGRPERLVCYILPAVGASASPGDDNARSAWGTKPT